jgi:hypothetical protein
LRIADWLALMRLFSPQSTIGNLQWFEVRHG